MRSESARKLCYCGDSRCTLTIYRIAKLSLGQEIARLADKGAFQGRYRFPTVELRCYSGVFCMEHRSLLILCTLQLLKPENEGLLLEVKCAVLAQRAACSARHTLTCKALAHNALARKMRV